MKQKQTTGLENMADRKKALEKARRFRVLAEAALAKAESAEQAAEKAYQAARTATLAAFPDLRSV